MATYTPNYHLSKPDNNDALKDFREAYNGNMDIIDQNLGGGGGSSGHTIQDQNGTNMTARSKLQFVNATAVTDNSANDRTKVQVLPFRITGTVSTGFTVTY